MIGGIKEFHDLMIKFLGENRNKLKFNDSISEINEKVEEFGKVFKPTFELIQHYGIITVLSLIVPFILPFLTDLINNPVIIDLNLILIVFTLILLIYIIYQEFSLERFQEYIKTRKKILYLNNLLGIEFEFLNNYLKDFETKRLNSLENQIKKEERFQAFYTYSKFVKRLIIKDILKEDMFKLFLNFKSDLLNEKDIRKIIKKSVNKTIKGFINNYYEKVALDKTLKYHEKFTKKVILWNLLKEIIYKHLKELKGNSINKQEFQSIANKIINKSIIEWEKNKD